MYPQAFILNNYIIFTSGCIVRKLLLGLFFVWKLLPDSHLVKQPLKSRSELTSLTEFSFIRRQTEAFNVAASVRAGASIKTGVEQTGI